MANPVALAVMVAVGLVLLHLQQVSLLSGSVSEFWMRQDAHARASKALFGLSLCCCVLIIFTPVFGMLFAIAFMASSLGLSMNEWKG